MFRQYTIKALGISALLALAACGSIGSGSLSGKGPTVAAGENAATIDARSVGQNIELLNGETVLVEQSSKRGLLGGGRGSASDNVQVNKYIWNAAIDVLSFLPVQSADPFTGVIVTGYGTPPGGGRAYRATIHVTDPALDARALNISLYTRNGAASVETIRAIEDAILTRARQLRSGK